MADYNSNHSGVTIDNAVTWANNLLSRFAWDNNESWINVVGHLHIGINSGVSSALILKDLSYIQDEDGNDLINPITKTSAMTQSVGIDSEGRLWTSPGSGGVTSIGAATGAITLGTGLSITGQQLNTVIDPDTKTSAETQSVTMDSNGKLWTAPGGGGGSSYTAGLGIDITSNVIKVTGSEYKGADGVAKAAALKFIKCTQAEYNGLVTAGTLDVNTLYIITLS